jgi:predicted dehydrogenase
MAAVASRSTERAAAFAGEHGIQKFYGSYDDLLADDSLHAVYIALPPRLNGEYSARAIRAGKHVLVEKPAAPATAQAREIEAAMQNSGCLFMEGFMYRFMRVHQRAQEILLEGTIGRLRYISFNFCFDIVNRGRTGYRMERDEGGGALLDLGIYGVDFLRFMTGTRPTLLHSITNREEDGGIDLFTHAIFGAGDALCTLTCSFNTDANYYVVSGDKGSITSPVAISGRQLPNQLRIHLLEGDKKYEETFPPENPYKAEIEYFARRIERSEEPFLNIANTLTNLEMIGEVVGRGEGVEGRVGRRRRKNPFGKDETREGKAEREDQ